MSHILNLKRADFSKICRTCLEQKEDMEPIQKTDIPRMLAAFTSIKISGDPNNDMPKLICTNCKRIIMETERFVSVIELNNKALMMMVETTLDQCTIDYTLMNIALKYDVSQQAENVEKLLETETESSSECLRVPKRRKLKKKRSRLKKNDHKEVTLVEVDVKIHEEQPDCEKADPTFGNGTDLESSENGSGSLECKMKGSKKSKNQQNPKSRKSKRLKCNTLKLSDLTKSEISERLKRARERLKPKRDAIDLDQMAAKNSYKCPICRKKIRVRSAFLHHWYKHDDEYFTMHQLYRRGYCNICQRTIDGSMKKHNDEMHAIKLEMDDPESWTNLQMKKRLREIRERLQPEKNRTNLSDFLTTDNKYKCKQCETIMKNEMSFWSHFYRHDAEYQRLYKLLKRSTCPLCNKSVSCSTTLKHHMQSHERKRNNPKLTCKICRKEYLNIDAHMATHQSRTILCNECGKVFLTKTSYWSHRAFSHRTRPVEKKFNCDRCSSTFTTKYRLTRHQNALHLKIRNHKCAVCEKCFSASWCLKAHMNSHTGARPYQCRICGNRFTASGSLYTHMKTHKVLVKSDVEGMRLTPKNEPI